MKKKQLILLILIIIFLTGCGSVYQISDQIKDAAKQVEINLDEQTLDEINQMITNERSTETTSD